MVLDSFFSMLPCGIIILDHFSNVVQSNQIAKKLLNNDLDGKRWSLINQKEFPMIKFSYCDWFDEKKMIVLHDLSFQEELNKKKRLVEIGKIFAELSHQIRTPLSSAIIYASNLKNNHITVEEKEIFIERLIERLMHIEQQIQDTFVFIQGEKGKIFPVNVNSIIENLFQAIELTLQNKKASFFIENKIGNHIVYIQKDVVLGALQSIVNNALEASTEKSKLNFVIQSEEKNMIDFIISDDGPGIPEKIISQVQEPFFTTKKEGTGLGLSVAKAVAKVHHGDLFINSKIGKGTQVGLRLPIYQGVANER